LLNITFSSCRVQDRHTALPTLFHHPEWTPPELPGWRPTSLPGSCNAAAPYRWHRERMTLRCLLVDDNATFLDAAAALLQREGVTVVGVASSTAQAIRQVRALQPDVVLIDIGLGDESGFDLARLLVRGGHGAELIMISARTETDHPELIAESPAAGFLAKPDLSAREIDRVLGRTSP
jgi:CheY-like chemotaxis protein